MHRSLILGAGQAARSWPFPPYRKCRITAVDIPQPYLDAIRKRAGSVGLGDRITTLRASMDDLPFAPGSFNVIWAK